MATKALARWAVNLEPSSVPSSVRKAAERSLYNYIGCAIGGSNHPTVSKAHAALKPLFGPSTASLFGHGGEVRTDIQHAALLNGIASHVHDYDDTELDTIIHPTGPVASAALAYSEYKRGISGEILLCALIAGIEAECKLGLAVWPTHYDIGWHITSTTGAIGAAVAVGKLMQLDETAMAHAIGLASVQVIGLREMFGSDTKSFHPGRAAQSGLLSALCAEQGFTSSEKALEAKRGWANVVVGGGTPQLDRYIAELGSKWETERNSFKPFPCGIVCHPAIDACIQLHKEMQAKGKKIEDIVSVFEAVHPLVIELTSKRTPSDGLQGKFSVFHGSAVGLLYGKAGPQQYADDVVTDPAVIEVRDKVDAEADEKLAADETKVTITFKDKTTLTKHVSHAIGSTEVPMSDSQLEEKFVDQCRPVLGDRSQAVSDQCWKIGDAKDVSDILGSL